MKEEMKDCTCTDSCDCGCHEGNSCTCEQESCNCGCEENDTCEGDCKEELCNDECDCKKDKKKDKHKNKIKELEQKMIELEEKSLRDKAELINYRKRKDEELSRLLKYSNEDIIKQLLPVVDNFERAIKMDDDVLDDQLSKFLEGFKMIYCNVISMLESFEVKAIDGANKLFDPTYHEAVMTEKNEKYEPGMVIEVLQKGYLLKDKIIRPAMVKVSE